MNGNKLDRLIRIDEVVFLTGLSKATIYWKMKERVFPIPKKLGERAVAWRLSDVQNWINSLPESNLE